jgi:hypothetical protein
VKLKPIDWQSSMKPACRARGSACRAERMQHLPPPVRGSISGPLVVQTLRTFVDDDRAFRLWLRHSSECGGWSPGRLTEVTEWLRTRSDDCKIKGRAGWPLSARVY